MEPYGALWRLPDLGSWTIRLSNSRQCNGLTGSLEKNHKDSQKVKTLFFHSVSGPGLQFSYEKIVLNHVKKRVSKPWFFICLFIKGPYESLKGFLKAPEGLIRSLRGSAQGSKQCDELTGSPGKRQHEGQEDKGP